MKRLIALLGVQLAAAALAVPCLQLSKEIALSLSCLDASPSFSLAKLFPLAAAAVLFVGHVVPPLAWAWKRLRGRVLVRLEMLQLAVSSFEIIASMLLLLRLTAALVYVNHGLACEPP